ncbi:hypothetical protein B0O99DRAFT_645223 [Bisporella sp. PMI_857]|nr:hypothetical protein B0O99DRAFT_645223 [Bisporella sp. PMI_857]
MILVLVTACTWPGGFRIMIIIRGAISYDQSIHCCLSFLCSCSFDKRRRWLCSDDVYFLNFSCFSSKLMMLFLRVKTLAFISWFIVWLGGSKLLLPLSEVRQRDRRNDGLLHGLPLHCLRRHDSKLRVGGGE